MAKLSTRDASCSLDVFESWTDPPAKGSDGRPTCAATALALFLKKKIMLCILTLLKANRCRYFPHFS